ncbi:MAG: hypothetical protein RI909_613, partial [Bacteroidota bacterium]
MFNLIVVAVLSIAVMLMAWTWQKKNLNAG